MYQRPPPLAPNTIHLWSCFCDQITNKSVLKQYHLLLEPEEKVKQERFYFPRHRHQYLVTRALVRSVLSFYGDIPPQDWRFVKNQYGRPEISPTVASHKPFTGLKFNLSHTDGLIICGVTLNQEIGVDVENIERENDGLKVADHYFSRTEVNDLFSQPEHRQKRRFFDYWTLKESYIKAKGMGLSLPLDQFSFLIPETGAINIEFAPELNDNPENWQFWQFKPSNRHQIALAIESTSPMSLNSYQIVPLETWSSFDMPAC